MALQILPSAPTDFDFVIGNWRVEHRRLSERLAGCDDWVEFDGAMSTHKILGGFGNVEDNLLCCPDGEFRALALRSYDPVKQQWSIWWLDGRFPGRLDVPVVGSFKEGVGIFFARDTFGCAPIIVRFQWSRINPDELRWDQAFSADDGNTWETNWTMNFFRQDER